MFFSEKKKIVPSTNAAWGGKGGSGLEEDAYLSFVGGFLNFSYQIIGIFISDYYYVKRKNGPYISG